MSRHMPDDVQQRTPHPLEGSLGRVRAWSFDNRYDEYAQLEAPEQLASRVQEYRQYLVSLGHDDAANQWDAFIAYKLT